VTRARGGASRASERGAPTDRVFLDTNVLVSADDLDAGPKNRRARAILRERVASRTAVLSTQVLQEFFVVSTGKLGVDPAIARRKVEHLATLEIVRIQVEDVLAAIDLHRLHGLAFWDALVVRSASVAGCVRLLTEDMQHGRTINGVCIENPFRAAG
jgi:predicted nucleic acid-binding protein